MQTPQASTKEPVLGFVQRHKLQLLGAAYVLVTGGCFWRISRQPYSRSMKWEHYETVFKGTTLAAAVAGIAVSGGANRKRSGPASATQMTLDNNTRSLPSGSRSCDSLCLALSSARPFAIKRCRLRSVRGANCFAKCSGMRLFHFCPRAGLCSS